MTNFSKSAKDTKQLFVICGARFSTIQTPFLLPHLTIFSQIGYAMVS